MKNQIIKLWIDDIRLPPSEDGEWIWVRTVNACKSIIDNLIFNTELILSVDHDSSVYYTEGGNYINILNYLEYLGWTNISIYIHSMNAVGISNMRAIIKANGWKELY